MVYYTNMQTKQELENWWSKEDPWGYETNPDDQVRKQKINEAISKLDINTILDIGAGEGFITRDLPVEKIYANEISDKARDRIPEWIIRHTDEMVDATLTCGTLYKQYDHETIADQLRKYAKKYIIVAGIKDWLIDYDFGKIIHQEEFPYKSNGHNYTQRLTIYETST